MKQQPKRILLLTYYWPPAGGPGVQRWLKLVRYLEQAGHSCTVITPAQPVASNYDESLLKEVPGSTEVIKTKARDPFRFYQRLSGKKGKITTGGIGLTGKPSLSQRLFQFIRANFFVPDARKGWNSYALKAARAVLAKKDFDAVITTGPPHSTHLIGRRLKKEQPNLRWLVDLRDPWTNIFYNRIFPRTAWTRRRDQDLETQVTREADLVLTVSPGLKQEFADRAQRIEVLYNGFDPADIPSPQGNLKGFHLAYTGNFKPNQNVKALWKALAALKVENPEFARDLRIDLLGNVDQSVQEALRKYDLESVSTMHGYQSHAAATQMMVDTAVLLFIVPQVADNELILTGKLFEYLGSGTALLSIGPPNGNAAQIIGECERGPTLDYGDKAAMKERILFLYQRWQTGSLAQQSGEAVQRYTRQGAAAQLINLIEDLA